MTKSRARAIGSPRDLRNLWRASLKRFARTWSCRSRCSPTERGYNQAELIARPLAGRLHLRQGAYLLVRTQSRPVRLMLSRKEHWESVRAAYATRKGLRVDKLRVLLVDDVMTAGASLDWCARAWKKGGSQFVWD